MIMVMTTTMKSEELQKQQEDLLLAHHNINMSLHANYLTLPSLQIPEFSSDANCNMKELISNTPCPSKKRSREGQHIVLSQMPAFYSACAASEPGYQLPLPTYSASQLLSLEEHLRSHVSKHRQETNYFIQMQEERMKQALEVRAHSYASSLVAFVEQKAIVTMKQKEADIEELSKRNIELDEKVKQLVLELQLWQNVAKNNQAIVQRLRNNLEEVALKGRLEQLSKEGIGDSQVDDAQSSCHNGIIGNNGKQNNNNNNNLEEKRICRECMSKEVCVLLLPCKHLCLCKECEGHVHVCPICRSEKNASVQVYMS